MKKLIPMVLGLAFAIGAVTMYANPKAPQSTKAPKNTKKNRSSKKS